MFAKQTPWSVAIVMALACAWQPAWAGPGTGSFTIGAGYSTDDKLLLRAEVAQSDLLGTGVGVSLATFLSGREQAFVLAVTVPHVTRGGTGLRAELYDTARRYPDFTRHATGSRFELTVPIAPHVRGFVGARFEHVDVTATVARVTPEDRVIATDQSRYAVAAALAGVEYSTVPAGILPSRGSSIGASIEIADRALGSDVQFLHTRAWMQHHRTLGPFVLHLDARVESEHGGPRSELLQFDGSSVVRGYVPGQLGPHDSLTGAALGGELAASARVELELPLSRRYGLSLVGFLDAGGLVGPEGGSAGAAAGIGLLWRSPIGPLRIDYAIPIDGRPTPVISFGTRF